MIFSFGHGYVARFLGTRGTTRSPKTPDQLFYSMGPFSTEIREALSHSRSVLISIPPEELGDPLIPYVRENLSLFKHLDWIGYLSATSVYGDHKGSWVDETSKTCPTSPQGKSRLKAEEQWINLRNTEDLPVHIFRLAGIYGPERNVLEQLKAGSAQRIFKENHVFSRIHVKDIVQALKASIAHPNPGRIYNLADNSPAATHEVITYGASLLKIEPPPLIPFEQAKLSPLGRHFYLDSKRVKNDRLIKELTPSLLFPTYKEGLQNIFEESFKK